MSDATRTSGRDLLVASNRGPVSIVAGPDGALDVVRGGGGLVSGMSAALRASAGLWVCCAMTDQERSIAAAAPNGHLRAAGLDTGGLEVRMLPVDAQTFHQAYNGIANETLWFVAHLLYDVADEPVFDTAFRQRWAGYQRYNQAFADALAAEAAPGATVMVQDYHLMLVPGMLRARRPDLVIGHFTHTPWAPVEYFDMLPDDVAGQILAGLLGADHLGFHCARWVDAFLSCCARLPDVEIDAARRMVRHEGRSVRVGVHALGTDAVALRERAAAPDVAERLARLRQVVGDRRVIGRVDRIEPSKNIIRGLLAYRELLRNRPQWRDRVVHVAYTYPSRQELRRYRDYLSAVRQLADEIVAEFSAGDWTPVVLETANDYAGSLAALRITDVLLVNSLRDGMNLVAQEGAILADNGCALVLSREAGALDLVGSHALVVNPFDVTGTAEALHAALSMPDIERRERAERMAAAASALPPAAWFADQLAALRG